MACFCTLLLFLVEKSDWSDLSLAGHLHVDFNFVEGFFWKLGGG